MADRVRQLSQKTTRELGEMLAEHRRRDQGAIGTAAEPNRNLLVPIRLAKTGTSERYVHYPIPPSDLIPVVFGEWQFFPDDYNDSGANVNLGAPEWLPYDPEDAGLIWSRYGWIPEGQVVECIWLHGRWHLHSEQWATRKAVANAEITAGNSGGVTVWHDGVATDYQPDAYNNWMNNGVSIGPSAEVIIRWFECEQAWVIIAAEC